MGDSGSDATVPYLNYDGGYTSVLVYRNPLNYTLRENFTIYKSQING